MALAALPGLGPIRIRKLDEETGGGVEGLLEMAPETAGRWCSPMIVEQLAHWREYFDPDRVREELKRLGADFLSWEEEAYPARLRPYPDCPVGLYRCRAGADLGGRTFAIVGTRRPSSYGRKVARIFATELSRAGFTIISGMAEGIDTEAHRAALAAGGRTAAVLGGGLNRCYPASNRDLMREIAASAGVWTEFPLWRSADKRSFPQRNRIVSALSEGVLVVESGEKGGSMITARMASEQGKPVYVIPGRIDAAESEGCHALVRDGAQLVTRVEHILEDVNYLPFDLRANAWSERNACTKPIEPELRGPEATIWELLGKRGQAHADAIAGDLGMPVRLVTQTLMGMELAGHVARRLDGCYERG